MRSAAISKWCGTFLLGAVLVAATGCGRPAGPVGPTPPPPGPAPADGDGPRYAGFRAEGSGCPAGSWNPRISDDGLVFTTTFSAFVVRVDPGQTEAAQDCRFTIRVHAPSGRSVALHTFSNSGYVNLTAGVRATVESRYWLQGSPIAPRSGGRNVVDGPYDAEFVLRDAVPMPATVSTPCGADGDLVIDTRALLQSPTGQGAAYLNISALDGSVGLETRLEALPCTPTGR